MLLLARRLWPTPDNNTELLLPRLSLPFLRVTLAVVLRDIRRPLLCRPRHHHRRPTSRVLRQVMEHLAAGEQWLLKHGKLLLLAHSLQLLHPRLPSALRAPVPRLQQRPHQIVTAALPIAVLIQCPPCQLNHQSTSKGRHPRY